MCFLVLFFFYGVYAAATESIAKAWISNISNKGDVAKAIGTYTGLQSLLTVVASSLAGIIWEVAGAQAVFIFSGVAALLLSIYLGSMFTQ